MMAALLASRIERTQTYRNHSDMLAFVCEKSALSLDLRLNLSIFGREYGIDDSAGRLRC